VDPILDKISAQGIQSLTDRERRILQAAARRWRNGDLRRYATKFGLSRGNSCNSRREFLEFGMIQRYSRHAMREIWSEQRKLRLASDRIARQPALSAEGLVPKADFARMKARPHSVSSGVGNWSARLTTM